ncbi:MAG: ankyrin repeat domain-containing protein [Thermoguttaceae bacterium]|nr:ankyrin repeat domain-containing protein [Thermoguttaceae bacterium]
MSCPSLYPAGEGPMPTMDIFHAIMENNIEEARRNISHCPEQMDTPDRVGWPPLIRALGLAYDNEDDYTKGRVCPEIFMMLVQAGANLDLYEDLHSTDCKGGRTLLYLTAATGYAELVQLLIEHGADPNRCNVKTDASRYNMDGECDTDPPIVAAALSGSMETFQVLLDHGVAWKPQYEIVIPPGFRRRWNGWLRRLLRKKRPEIINQTCCCRRYYGGQTLLHAAAKGGNTSLVKLLLDAGADPNVEYMCPQHSFGKDVESYTPLLLAVENDHPETVKALLDAGADPNISNDKDITPLSRANLTEITKLLLDAGAKVDDDMLYHAVQYGELESVRLLLNAGVKVTVRTKKGITPLHWAKCGAMVKLLLDAGADPKAVTDQGMTTLCCGKDTEAIRLLLEAGADPTVPVINECLTPLQQPLTPEGLRLLLDAGAGVHVNTTSSFGWTPFYEAVQNGSKSGDTTVARMLLEVGADPHLIENGSGESPLHIAIRESNGKEHNTNMVKFLLELGLERDVREEEHGETPLFYAVIFNYIEVVKMLLDAGADPNILNIYGETPLDWAEHQNFSELVVCLRAAGAKHSAELPRDMAEAEEP